MNKHGFWFVTGVQNRVILYFLHQVGCRVRFLCPRSMLWSWIFFKRFIIDCGKVVMCFEIDWFLISLSFWFFLYGNVSSIVRYIEKKICVIDFGFEFFMNYSVGLFWIFIKIELIVCEWCCMRVHQTWHQKQLRIRINLFILLIMVLSEYLPWLSR